jgi:DNA-binding NarL/FixJ family response regulator
MNNNKKIKVVFCDDHQVVIEGLSLIFERENELQILGSFKEKSDLLSYLNHAETEKPDVVIVDFQLGRNDSGLDLPTQIVNGFQYRWILFSAFVDDFLVFKAKKMGFDACFSKDVPTNLLIHTILNSNIEFVSYPVIENQGKDKLEELFVSFSSLTKREKDILKAIVTGKPSKETADLLHISVFTLETHKKNIFRKLDINSLPELIRIVDDYKLLA